MCRVRWSLFFSLIYLPPLQNRAWWQWGLRHWWDDSCRDCTRDWDDRKSNLRANSQKQVIYFNTYNNDNTIMIKLFTNAWRRTKIRATLTWFRGFGMMILLLVIVYSIRIILKYRHFEVIVWYSIVLNRVQFLVASTQIIIESDIIIHLSPCCELVGWVPTYSF